MSCETQLSQIMTSVKSLKMSSSTWRNFSSTQTHKFWNWRH